MGWARIKGYFNYFIFVRIFIVVFLSFFAVFSYCIIGINLLFKTIACRNRYDNSVISAYCSRNSKDFEYCTVKRTARKWDSSRDSQYTNDVTFACYSRNSERLKIVKRTARKWDYLGSNTQMIYYLRAILITVDILNFTLLWEQ